MGCGGAYGAASVGASGAGHAYVEDQTCCYRYDYYSYYYKLLPLFAAPLRGHPAARSGSQHAAPYVMVRRKLLNVYVTR